MCVLMPACVCVDACVRVYPCVRTLCRAEGPPLGVGLQRGHRLPAGLGLQLLPEAKHPAPLGPRLGQPRKTLHELEEPLVLDTHTYRHTHTHSS